MEACVDADEKGEALKYIPKLTDPRERAEVTETLVLLFSNRSNLLIISLTKPTFIIYTVLCSDWHGQGSC